MKLRGWVAVFCMVFLAVVGAQPAQRFDLLIRNGRVMDGTGNPVFINGTAVVDGGRLTQATPGRILVR